MMGNRTVLSILCLTILLLASNVSSFKLNSRSNNRGSGIPKSFYPIAKSESVSTTQLHMDATLIPMLVGATGLIFAGNSRYLSDDK